MPSAVIVKVWRDRGGIHMAARVQEVWGGTEYIGTVPLDQAQEMTISELRDALGLAVKDRRGEVIRGTQEYSITGTITV